ncbi:hypothetical protein [Endozoicomonas arenosclerae]|nr:hypothetical protein [Endozoicomonas arenosclerae]
MASWAERVDAYHQTYQSARLQQVSKPSAFFKALNGFWGAG